MEDTQQPQVEVFEKIAQLYPTISLWKVSISRTVEQTQNANVMDTATFELLTRTIAKEKALESLPFGYLDGTDPQRLLFVVISGHHRKRAAAAAGETEIYVLVSDRELSPDEIRQKQLAHNAISGTDDPQILKEIFSQIGSVQARIDSGISEVDLDKAKFRPVSTDALKFDLSFRSVKFIFMDSQLEQLDRVAGIIEKDDTVVIADLDVFDRFTAALRKLSGVEGVRNGAALLTRMLELTEEYVGKQTAAIEGSTSITPKKAVGARKPIGFGHRNNDNLKPGME